MTGIPLTPPTTPPIVLIVCARQYNGHELWTALGMLQEAGIDFEVISTHLLISDEVTKQQNTIAHTISDIPPSYIGGYQGLMFVSGNMQDTELYWSHPRVLDYVEEAKRLDLPIAAICCSVPIIRGAARGKKVSLFPLVRAKQLLENAGAILQTVSITQDGNLVTAEHQMATQIWARTFIEVMKGEPVTLALVESNFEPAGSERSLPPILERLRGTDTSYRQRKEGGV